MDPHEYILDARDVCHTYRDQGVDNPVLHGVDLRVRRGEFVLIMGPSGCGKTTLLHILGLMMRPTGGRVLLDGVDATAAGDSARTVLRRRQIGFVFQRFNLLPILSARGNLDLALRLRGASLNGQSGELLHRIGLAGKEDRKPRALSIGEQQRVAIARAIVGGPRLLLADEPTGNLDSRNAADVLDLILSLHASAGLTTVMITHNEHLATRADRILHMADGRLVEASP